MSEPGKPEIAEPEIETETIPKGELETLRKKSKEHDSYGGQRRTLEAREQAVKESEARLTQEQQARDVAAREAAKDNLEELSALEARVKARDAIKERDEIKRERDRLAEDLGEATKGKTISEQEQIAKEIAEAANVDPKPLIQASHKLDKEELAALAKNLPPLTEEKRLIVNTARGGGGGGSESLEILMGKELKSMNQSELKELNQALKKLNKGSLLGRK